MAISFFDIGILVLIVLVGLMGIFQGFFKMVVGFFGWFITLIIAFFLTSIVAYALLDVNFISGFVLMNERSIYNWATGWISQCQYFGECARLLCLSCRLTNGANEYAIAGFYPENMAAAMFAYFILCAIVFVILFILLRLVMMLLTFFLKKIKRSEDGPRPLSRILGMLVGFARGFLYACLILMVVSYVIHFPFLEAVYVDIQRGFLARHILSWMGYVSDWMMTSNNYYVSIKIAHLFAVAGLTGNGYTNGSGYYYAYEQATYVFQSARYFLIK
ncbi:MAG: CvpA family protein [Firmicutes bacterium]|nr:CvpA family protein [Bacillota bacterium]